MTSAAPASRRLLLLVPNLAHGGAEAQVAHLARGLAERGDAVTLACVDRVRLDTTHLEDAGVHVLELGAERPAAKAAALPRLRRLARDADLVHCGKWDASLYGRLAALAARRPVTVADHSADRSMVVSASGRPRGRLIAWHHRMLAPRTAATVACAAAQLPLLRSEGVPAERLVLIPNGVPVAELRRTAEESRLTRADLGVPEDALVVVQVGRLTPEKEQRVTVKAVAALREGLGDVHAVFVGDGADRTAPDAARALGADWAHFLGGRSDVPAILALADLAVLPSRVDAFPLAALEAMAVGVPQVTSDVGDLPAVVAGSGAGPAVAAGDLEAFTRACRQLLADPGERARVGARAAERAWDWDVGRMVERFSELFTAVLAGRPLPAAGD